MSPPLSLYYIQRSVLHPIIFYLRTLLSSQPLSESQVFMVTCLQSVSLTAPNIYTHTLMYTCTCTPTSKPYPECKVWENKDPVCLIHGSHLGTMAGTAVQNISPSLAFILN